MVKVKNVKIENFLSVESCEVDFSTLGLCLVKGYNGSGKSTIYRKSLEYLLFGTVPEKIRSDDFLRDFDSKKPTSLVGNFTVDDKEVVVERYRNHPIHSNNIRVFVNGADVSTTDNRKTQQLINQLFGVDFETFESSTCFNNKAILFAESTSSNRSSLLTKILQLDKYILAHRKAKDSVTSLTNKIGIDKAKLDTLTKQIEDQTESLADLYKKRADCVDNSKISYIDRELKIVFDSFIDIGNIKKEEQELVSKGEETSNILNSYLTEINTLSQKQSALSSELRYLRNEYASLTKAVENKICPTCKQLLPNIESLSNKQNEINLKIVGSEKELRDTVSKLQLTKNSYDVVNNKLLKISIGLDSIKTIIEKEKDKKYKISTLEAERKNLIDLKENLDGYINQVKEKIEKYTQESNSIKLDIVGKEEELKYYKFWEVGFSPKGIPNLIIEQALSNLESYTNEYLNKTGLKVTLSAQKELKSKAEMREEITVKINDKGVDKFYENLSAGEQRRINIALLFAILDISNNKFNIMILDELFDSSLDGVGSEMVMSILKKKIETLDSIIVISHKNELQDKFENVITVNKTEGGSQIING